ncbi:MAG: fibronectin type III domain-containing protein [Nitrosomonadales bacterium]
MEEEAEEAVQLLQSPALQQSPQLLPETDLATVSFTAPTNNGGSPITGYTVTVEPGGTTITGTASPITINNLTGGTAYTFTVTATNSIGTGSPRQSLIR